MPIPRVAHYICIVVSETLGTKLTAFRWRWRASSALPLRVCLATNLPAFASSTGWRRRQSAWFRVFAHGVSSIFRMAGEEEDPPAKHQAK